jgi:23S rRNA pseudouridine2605 synthase
MAEMRLQKFLSQAGKASRRKSETLIEAGRVTVNGKVAILGTKVDPEKDEVVLDGAQIKPLSSPLYFVMNKPREFLCTESDPEHRPTVYKLLPPGLPRMFTVGRLDWDTEGLLLFTTDGDLATALTDPSRAVPRIYEVKIQGEPDPHLLRRFNEGVKLDDGRRTRPSPTELMSKTKTNAWYSVILTEGMNRQIHRMAIACGRRVLKIRRVQFGPINLGQVRIGHIRALHPMEVTDLVTSGGLGGKRRAEHFRKKAREPVRTANKATPKSRPAQKKGFRTPKKPS